MVEGEEMENGVEDIDRHIESVKKAITVFLSLGQFLGQLFEFFGLDFGRNRNGAPLCQQFGTAGPNEKAGQGHCYGVSCFVHSPDSVFEDKVRSAAFSYYILVVDDVVADEVPGGIDIIDVE